MANGGEGIAEFPVFRSGVADAIGREQRKIERTGNCNSGAVASFFVTMKMTLQFDVDIAATKYPDQLFDLLVRCLDAAMP
jgi:hypothetical protein